ncbi:fasciclin domain-containing protein [Gramella jeungdoensis]|uniref:Fasciclin domain-containing protein n=1 Tax=Gramella jeungdoensis TaxID=708091 RepID=A0ABT0YXC7_9FLAO|nr:fasciclin domain-containing protein [Gramella jeungdoensis]MCM8568113.1 fasciclin domain-containing protein [Gramella jeungdoensis]
MKNLRIFTTLCLFLITVNLVIGQNEMADTKMVGGAEMYPSKNIVENAVNSKDHTTLVAAVKAAELVDVLKSDGPFTVFAPTNTAFEDLPAGTVETLLKEENQKKLQAVLTYHVLAGDYEASDIVSAIKKGNGKASFETVNGGKISAMLDGDEVKLKDAAGNVATVTIADVDQSNGVIHVIDSVLLPAK